MQGPRRRSGSTSRVRSDNSGAAQVRRVAAGGLLGTGRLLSEADGFRGTGLAGKDSRFLAQPGHPPWSLGAALAHVGRSTGSVIKHLNLVPLILWGALHLLGSSVHRWSCHRARDGAAEVTRALPSPHCASSARTAGQHRTRTTGV